MIVVDGVELGRCVTVKEAAARLGISEESARRRLRRLEDSGAVERRLVGRTALYCAREGGVVLRKPPVRGLGVKTRRRIKQVCDILEREGCVSTSVLVDMFNLDSGNIFHLMKRVIERGCAVKVGVGNTALWCRDRAAAEALVTRLRETVHRLALENRIRYATPTKILRAVLRDRDAYALLSRFITLSRNVKRFPPAALKFVDSVLRSLYGEPLKYRRRTVYIVSQPRDYTIDITDKVDTHIVQVKLTDDLAETLVATQNIDSLVLDAIEQLLARYKA
jgi:DNA-binding Lrp family transcriptional regulator